jgi:hypothetical protein
MSSCYQLARRVLGHPDKGGDNITPGLVFVTRDEVRRRSGEAPPD